MSSGFGPGFQDAGSKLYRAEYTAISLTIFGYLAWRAVNLGGVDWIQLGFWVIFPDLLAFSGIALSSKRREWPSWGPDLYNSSHTILLWGVIFAASWFALGTIYWPLFGWLEHITLDRAVGYALRDRTKR
jgi:hypothetical protein